MSFKLELGDIKAITKSIQPNLTQTNRSNKSNALRNKLDRPLSVRIECAHYSVNYFVRMDVANAFICYFYSTMALVSHLKAIL